MIVIDREYAIQILIQEDMDDEYILQQCLFKGFVGYNTMTNEQILKVYNSRQEKAVNRVV